MQINKNKEGTEIAEWLNSLGFSAAVLLYRTDDRDAAFSDAQRLIRLLRAHADEYQIKADKIGVIGFSAGANLAVRLSTNWRKSAYARIDEVDDISCRPDFMMPIYPWDLRPRKNPANPWHGWLKTYELDSAYPVDAETPPAFIVQSLDDFCEIETAVGLDLALTKAGVRSMAAAEAMTDLSSAEYDKDGCLADADGIVASLRRENPWLFDSGETVSSAPEYRERRAPDYSKMSDEEDYRYVDGENR